MSTPSGNDPFSGSSVQNVLQHTISPKIVTDGSGGYTVKTDLINVDNIYLSGSVISSGGGGTGSTYLVYNTGRFISTTYGCTGVSGYFAIPNTGSIPPIISGKSYLVSVNIYYEAVTPLTGDNIFFSLGNGPSTLTNVSTPVLYPFTTNLEPNYSNPVGFTTLTGIFVSNGVAPQVIFNWNCLSSITGRNFTVTCTNFGCIQLN